MSDDDGNTDDLEILPTEQSTVDASSLATLRESRRRAAFDKQNADGFWHRVFADPVGRAEMWKLLTACHTFEERFACGPSGFPQPEATWFHAGEQSIGLRLYQTWLRLDPIAVMQMQTEHDPRFADPKRKSKGGA
ncbi:MAG TPA: hypothetical protein PLO16_12685 [Acidocella sp.]|nr:hypothetical protein [Acidocella sp.]